MATILGIITSTAFLMTVGRLVFISNSENYQEKYQNNCTIADYEIVKIAG